MPLAHKPYLVVKINIFLGEMQKYYEQWNYQAKQDKLLTIIL